MSEDLSVSPVNLMGTEPEQFYGSPQLTGISIDENGEKRFFVLECETLFKRKRKEWTTSRFYFTFNRSECGFSFLSKFYCSLLKVTNSPLKNFSVGEYFV